MSAVSQHPVVARNRATARVSATETSRAGWAPPPILPPLEPAPTRPWWKQWWAIAVLGLVAAVVIGALLGGPTEEAALLDEAIVANGDGRFDDALVALDELMASEPDGVTLAVALTERSYSHGMLGEFEHAVADTTAAIQLEPDDAEILAMAHTNRGWAHGELREFELAVNDATAAIDLEPNDVDALALPYLNRSFALYELSRAAERSADFVEMIRLREEALADLAAAIELGPSNDRLASAYLSRSTILRDDRRFSEALANDTAAIEVEPSVDLLAKAHLFRADDLDTMGRTGEAESDLRIVVDLLSSGHELRDEAEQLLSILSED